MHCEITGFGRDHPLSDVPGHEGVVASAAGRAHEFSVLFDVAATSQTSAWYFANNLVLIGVVAAIAVWGFWKAVPREAVNRRVSVV